MMKKITLLAAAFIFSLGMNAQVFYEDFESGIPADWTQVQFGGSGMWTTSTSPWGITLSGSNTVAMFDDDDIGDNSFSDNVALVSPEIDLSVIAANASLSFDYANFMYEELSSITVEVWDGSSWMQVFYAEGDQFVNQGGGTYSLLTEVIDISAYNNTDFQVRFIYDDGGDWSYGALIDKVAVDGTLSNKSNNITGFNQHYSSTSKNLTITANDAFSNISIYNVLGQEIVSQSLSSTTEVINLSSLKDGVYIANVIANGQSTSFKIAKR